MRVSEYDELQGILVAVIVVAVVLLNTVCVLLVIRVGRGTSQSRETPPADSATANARNRPLN